jgi:hypothetical protein
MIELNGELQHILRSYQKEASSVRKSSPKESSTDRPDAGPAMPGQEEDGAKVNGAAAGPSLSPLTPINFQYIPSGRIHLNEESRQHIIDFFQ